MGAEEACARALCASVRRWLVDGAHVVFDLLSRFFQL